MTAEKGNAIEIDVEAPVIGEAKGVERKVPAGGDAFQEVGTDEAEVDNGCSS